MRILMIGDIVGAFAYYCAGTLWLRGNEEKWKQWGGFEGMEYQMTPELIDRAWANMFVKQEAIAH